MCVWVVAWMFMCVNKGIKHASESEKKAAISINSKAKLPRFAVLSMHERHFTISPDCGISKIVSGPKVCINTISGPKHQLSKLERSKVDQPWRKEHQRFATQNENTAPVRNGSFMPNNCQGMAPQTGGMMLMTGARLLLLISLSS
jgi:hypothetical protein